MKNTFQWISLKSKKKKNKTTKLKKTILCRKLKTNRVRKLELYGIGGFRSLIFLCRTNKFVYCIVFNRIEPIARRMEVPNEYSRNERLIAMQNFRKNIIIITVDFIESSKSLDRWLHSRSFSCCFWFSGFDEVRMELIVINHIHHRIRVEQENKKKKNQIK